LDYKACKMAPSTKSKKKTQRGRFKCRRHRQKNRKTETGPKPDNWG